MRIREIAASGLMVAVTVVLSQIAVPLPFSPVPVSLGVLAVFFCGVLLNPAPAMLSQLAYVLLGAIGLPVYARFSGGVGILLGPTGGFLAAYPLMALIVSFITAQTAKRPLPARFAAMAASMALAMVVCYALGAGWFAFSQNASIKSALTACVVPFILPDAAKIAVGTIVAPVLQARLGRYLRSRPAIHPKQRETAV